MQEIQEIATTLKIQAVKGLLAAVLLSVPLLCTSLPALAQTDHSGSGTPQSGGTVAPPKGAATDKGTYTTVDTVGGKAAGTIGTYGNTREMQDGNVGGMQDTTRGTSRSSTSTQGNRTGSYGNTSTGTGLPLDITRQEGGQYGTTSPSSRQDTTGREGGLGNTGTNPSRSGAASDTMDGGSKASHESGSRTNNGSQLNSNRTRQSGSGKKQ